MNPIFSALGAGYGADEILEYISKAIPKMAPNIMKAKKSGYGVQQILGFLSKTFDTENRKGMSTTERLAANKRSDSEMTKYGLKMAATAVAAPLAAGAVGSALQRALPTPLKGFPSQLTSQIGAMSPSVAPNIPGQNIPSSATMPPIAPAGNNVTQPSAPPINQQAPTIPQPPQPIQPQRDVKKSVDIIKSTGQEATVKNLIEGGLPPSQIKDTLGVILGKKKLKELEKATGGIEQAIEDYASSMAQEQVEAPQEMAKDLNIPEMTSELPTAEMMPESNELVEKPIQEAKPIKKADTVATPQGIGEIKEIRNGKAIVEVDGKLHKVDEDELETEPKDVIEEVQQLLKIPEVDRSSIVSLFTFDPEERKMYIQFHTGDTYKYLDVDPEKVMKIANKMGIPVTKGKNIFGAWSPEDKKSLGATLIKEIINDPKYKKSKKGEEPNKNYVQLETLYDYWQGLRKKPKKKI